MQGITNKEFLALQKDYLDTRTERSFSALYRVILAYCNYAVYCKIKKQRQVLSGYDIDRLANDAATQFAEMYLKHKDWKCAYFKTRINRDIANVLYQKRPNHLRGINPDRAYYQNTEPLHEMASEGETVEPSDDVARNREVMKAAYFSETETDYIKAIESIKGMHYVKRNIKELRDIYKLTRGPYGKKKSGDRKGGTVRKDPAGTQGMVQESLQGNGAVIGRDTCNAPVLV